MSVDLSIAGDSAAIRAVADWLDPGIGRPASDADSHLLHTAVDSNLAWEGESGTAFRGAVAAVHTHTSIVTAYLRDTASAFRAYANRLDRGRDWFEDMKEQCIDNGLTVVGPLVAVPVSVPFADDDGPDEDRVAYAAYAQQADLYRQLSENVGTWWGDLEVWLEQNMQSLTLRFADLDALGTFVNALFADPALVKEGLFRTAEQGLEEALTAMRRAASSRQVVVDAALATAMAGNSVARGAVATARGLSRGLESFHEAIRAVSRGGPMLPVVGIGTDIAMALVRVAEGDSPVTVGLGAAVSAGVGAVLTPGLVALAGTWEIPVVGEIVMVGVGVAVVATAAGQAAEWAYEANVPIDIRESIDAALEGPPPQLDTSSYATGGS